MSKLKWGVLAVLLAGVLTGCASVDRYAAPLTIYKPIEHFKQNLERNKAAAESNGWDKIAALEDLASMYASGWGVPKDTAKAQYYLQKLSEDVPQLAKLMKAYDYSNGWKQFNTEGQNHVKATQLYEEALAMPKNGYINMPYYLSAISNLQGNYVSGFAGKKDPQRVFELYKLAEPYFAIVSANDKQVSTIRTYRAVIICRGQDPESQDKEMAREWLKNHAESFNNRFARQQLQDCK